MIPSAGSRSGVEEEIHHDIVFDHRDIDLGQLCIQWVRDTRLRGEEFLAERKAAA
jgi:hypothetical protein